MRFLGLIGHVLVPGISAATLGWWLAMLAMRLLLRRLERVAALAQGQPARCALVLAGCFLLAGTLGGAAAWLTVRGLGGLVTWAGFSRDNSVVWLWQGVLRWTGVAAVLVAYASAAKQAVLAMGSARRRWELLGLAAAGPAPRDADPLPDTAPGGRRIVILCDGTSNRPDETEDGLAAPTNVYKLFQALVSDEAQTVWYQAGVGSDSSSTAQQARRTRMGLAFVGANSGTQVAAFFSRLLKLFEGAFGSGISETIVNGYTEIVRQYRPGDHIYLVGFSRGAFAARCIAGVILRCGLLRAGNVRYAAEVVQIFRCRARPTEDAPVLASLRHKGPVVEFVGVFDTVASLGVPLWGWWFRFSPIWRTEAFTTDPARICRHVYHALSMDEQRSQFLPCLYTRPEADPDSELLTLKQVWFRGGHGDIGGGYARTELSDITLAWMMDAMAAHHLRFRPGARTALSPAPLARLHSELDLRPSWQVFGSWPRWHPVPVLGPGHGGDPQGTELHPGVLERSIATERQAGRFDMHCLAMDEAVVFTAEAHRAWHRPGLAIETGGLYRLTWLGQRWRDASAPPCGPAGQDAAGWSDLRRFWTSNRRLPDRAWMQLAITVAHPRIWLPEERSLRELMRLLFGNDPPALRRQLAPIGPALAAGPVLLRSDAPAGLLYLFANDWWQTASNNSGGLSLRIERVAAGTPDLVLDAAGAWSGPALT